MKLVLIGPVYPFRGGIAHFTTLLAEELVGWFETFIISFSRLYPSWLYPGKSDKDPSQRPLHVEAEFLIDTLNPWTWWRTARRINEYKPDGVIIEWWTTFLAPAYIFLLFLLRRNKPQILFLIHNVFPHEPRLFDRWMTYQVLKRGHGFIVLTKGEKERLLELCPLAETSIKISPLPIFDMFINQQIPKLEALQRLGLPQGLPILLFFGIVRPYKGINYLLESLAILKGRGIEVYTLIVGEWWMKKKPSLQFIKRRGLSRCIQIEDRYVPNEEVGLYFSAADLFIAPYIRGTQSGAAKIAMSFGLPMILTDRIAEGIQDVDKHVLYVVPSSDATALARVIEERLTGVPLMKQPRALSADQHDLGSIRQAVQELMDD